MSLSVSVDEVSELTEKHETISISDFNFYSNLDLEPVSLLLLILISFESNSL